MLLTAREELVEVKCYEHFDTCLCYCVFPDGTVSLSSRYIALSAWAHSEAELRRRGYELVERQRVPPPPGWPLPSLQGLDNAATDAV